MVARSSRAPDALSTTLAALADPTRRELVQMLRERPRPAGELAAAFALSAPAISKHLRVLRHGLLVEETRDAADARLRVYRLRREPFDDLGDWLSHMRDFWTLQLDAFARHANALATPTGNGAQDAGPARARRTRANAATKARGAKPAKRPTREKARRR